MKFAFRTATDADTALLNNDTLSYHPNMSDEMKDLLTACNKLKVGSTANEDTIILELESGKERTQMKTQLVNNRKYISGGVLQMVNRDKGTLILRKVPVPDDALITA